MTQQNRSVFYYNQRRVHVLVRRDRVHMQGNRPGNDDILKCFMDVRECMTLAYVRSIFNRLYITNTLFFDKMNKN